MRSLKRDLWKYGIAIASMLFFLALMAWIPASMVHASGEAPGFAQAGTVTVQTTPTADTTVTALQKEQLSQQVAGQQHTWNNWLWSNAAAVLSSFLSILVVVIGALVGLWRWLGDRRDEREKRAEERFQAAVTGLGDEKEGARIGAAILLRTFLHPGYKQFYTQVFDLAVAHLRLSRTPRPLEHPDTPLPLTTLSQALIVAFKESFPLARNSLKKGNAQFNPQSLDASRVQLDNAYLNFASLEQAWMVRASLREANLFEANLHEANLSLAHLSGANLLKAKLTEVSLFGADLHGARLNEAKLNGAKLSGANLLGANLSGADLSEAKIEDALYLYGTNLRGVNGLTKEQLEICQTKGAIIDENPAKLVGVDLSGMDLTGMDFNGADLTDAKLVEAVLGGTKLNEAKLVRADLTGAYLADTYFHLADLTDAKLIGAVLSDTDLSGANLNGADIESAVDLRKTNLRGVKGLTKEQLKACKARGAIVDENSTISSPQPPVVAPGPLQSNITLASPTPPTQGNVSAPHENENNVVSPQQNPTS